MAVKSFPTYISGLVVLENPLGFSLFRFSISFVGSRFSGLLVVEVAEASMEDQDDTLSSLQIEDEEEQSDEDLIRMLVVVDV